MIARPLPVVNAPNSTDFVSGQWSGRLGDAGDYQLIFPNKEASDGIAWRNRFDASGMNQWIEISYDGYVEFIGCVEKVEISREQVTVSGHDGWFALKKAYERDLIITQAPRDVIERASQVWMPVVADGFSSASLDPQWLVNLGSNGGSITATTTGVKFAVPATPNAQVTLYTAPILLRSATAIWRATADIQWPDLKASTGPGIRLSVFDSGNSYQITIQSSGAQFIMPPATAQQTGLQVDVTYNLLLESDGEWVWAFINGGLVGVLRRSGFNPTPSIETHVDLLTSGAAGTSMTLTNILVEASQPFMNTSTDKGDYVLPGDATTYPIGGLHARYSNNADLASDTYRLSKIHAPSRMQAYGSASSAHEYANKQDAQIHNQQNPLPGAATSYWSCIWFGAIWLKLSAGDYQMQIDAGSSTNAVVRVWIGNTMYGTQLVEGWGIFSNTTFTFTVSAAALSGSLPYGGGKVARDGWYPVKVEFAVDNVAGTAPNFAFHNIPVTYTDPGGTVLTAGQQPDVGTTVPSTSLSPLGCWDNRHQGISHFDLLQQVLIGIGYQASTQPRSLESGAFPGVLAPRLREGRDTDIVLEPDDTARKEGLLDYSNTLDGTDAIVSLQGNGAGFQSGNIGQLQANVYDPATLDNSLFDLQGWVDFSDASFLPLLQALLNSQLGLRLSPWQLVAGNPIGRERLTYTWPLPGTLVEMRWRPGDGVRINATDVNIIDLTPRQLLLVTRSIHPNGSTGVQVGFAARPRTDARALKQITYQATRWQRNNQRTKASLAGNWLSQSLTAGATSNTSVVVTIATDQIIASSVRVTANSGSQPFTVLLNGVDQSTALNGPWQTIPVTISMGGAITPDAGGQITVAIKNNGASASIFNFQLFLDVVR